MSLGEREGDDFQPESSPADSHALTSALYAELKKIASKQLKFEWSSRTLNTTALVNEAYVVLDRRGQSRWESKAHFLATASVVMRHVVIDYARRRKRIKRGGDAVKVSLENSPEVMDTQRADYLLALDEALSRYAKFDERGAKIVECRFFGGLTQKETGDVLGISERTVRNHWTMAKAWLKNELSHFD